MWMVAGILLGLVVVAALVGFHSGPHTHALGGFLGLLAAGWLVLMAVDGRSLPTLLALLSADVVVCAGLGVLAWKGLGSRRLLPVHRSFALAGAEGVAVTDLNPAGVVRVLGENWSAVAVNGQATAGTPVQVLETRGVRLDVWAETDRVGAPAQLPPGAEQRGKGGDE
jgi:membrane-bound ClpP family serine protease